MQTKKRMSTYPAIRCKIIFDDENQNPDDWPKTMCCKPDVGDIVRGLDGRRGRIESVAHSFSVQYREDEPDIEFQIPFLHIELKVTK